LASSGTLRTLAVTRGVPFVPLFRRLGRRYPLMRTRVCARVRARMCV
jgi:hypothetical protein